MSKTDRETPHLGLYMVVAMLVLVYLAAGGLR